MDIYIKPVKKATVLSSQVKIKDISEVIAPKAMKDQIAGMVLCERKDGKDIALISVSDIVKKVTAAFPEATVNNLGEMDTVIQFDNGKKENKIWQWLKVVFVVLVLLTGASTAIMSFHSDAQMYKVFENYNKIFIGGESEKPYAIVIPYSVGLALGIIVFFNHFAGKKVTNDPTPIEVEMSKYEADVTDTMIDNLNVQKSKNGAGKKQ